MSGANTCMLAITTMSIRDLRIPDKNFNKAKIRDKDDRYTSVK